MFRIAEHKSSTVLVNRYMLHREMQLAGFQEN